jgi:hypothetical protein
LSSFIKQSQITASLDGAGAQVGLPTKTLLNWRCQLQAVSLLDPKAALAGVAGAAGDLR